MSETRSANKRPANSKESGSQITRTSQARTARIRRTREVIERVEVEHVAEAGELPVVTTAEQRVIKATEMERGKHLSDEALPQEQVTSSSHAARKQPGRGAKKPPQAQTDIPIAGDNGPTVHVLEVAQDEARQNGPPFMSTQDYLEEAEELLHHPLEPNPLDTQPEDAAPEAAAGEQEEPDAGNLTEQAPEEAAAAGERLAAHIQPAARTETPGDTERQGADSAAHASEGGLVGRVAQVGRQIVRSLLHPNDQGHEEPSAASAGTAAGGDQGERSDQEQAGGVVAAIAEVARTAVEAGVTRDSSQAGEHRSGPEYRTLAEVAAEVAAEAAQPDLGLLETQAADSAVSGRQTAPLAMPAEAMPAKGRSDQAEETPEEATDLAEAPALAAEAGQVAESGYESDTGDQDETPAAASMDLADVSTEEVQPIAAIPSFAAAAAVRADEVDDPGAADDQHAVDASAELVAMEAVAGGACLAAPSPAAVAAPDEAAAGDAPYMSQDGTAAQVQPPVAAQVAPSAGEHLPDEEDRDLAQEVTAAAADTVLPELAVGELSMLPDEAAADVQSAAEPPLAPDPAVTEAVAGAPATEAEGMVVLTVGAAVDQQLAADPVSSEQAAQDDGQEAGQEVPSEQFLGTAPEARTDAHAAVDQAEAEAAVDALAAAAEPEENEAEPVMVSLHSNPASSPPEEALVAAAAAAVEEEDGVRNEGSGRVDTYGGLGLDEDAAAAAADEFVDGNVADETHEHAQGAGTNAEEAAVEPTEPATGATQEYHVEEPDHSASEAEEPTQQPSEGRGRAKKADTTSAAQAADTSAEANPGGSDPAGGKRGRGGVKKLKPYTPAKMAATRNTPKEVQPVEEVLGAEEGEATPEEEAAPAPATPPAKRGRPAAPKTPPHTKGKGKAAAEKAQEEPAAPEAEGSAPKKARGRPSKAAKAPEPSKPSNPAKRSRVEPAEPQEAGDSSKKSRKQEEASNTPAREARKPAPAEPEPKSASKPPARSPAAKSPPKKAASKAPAKKASARAKGPQKRPARQTAGRRKDRPESFKIYIHRVLKEIHPDISLSQKAISVLDSFTKDMHDRIAKEAGDLCRRHNRATLSSREIDAAIRFLLPGELFNHAVAEGRKAVTRVLSKSKQ